MIACHAAAHTHTKRDKIAVYSIWLSSVVTIILLRERKEIKIYSLRTSDNFLLRRLHNFARCHILLIKMLGNKFACWRNWFSVCVVVCVCVIFLLHCDLKCLSYEKRKKKFLLSNVVADLVLAQNQWNHKSNNSHQNLSHNFHSKYKIICIKLFHYVSKNIFLTLFIRRVRRQWTK